MFWDGNRQLACLSEVWISVNSCIVYWSKSKCVVNCSFSSGLEALPKGRYYTEGESQMITETFLSFSTTSTLILHTQGLQVEDTLWHFNMSSYKRLLHRWAIYSMTCVDMHVCFYRFPSMLLCVGTSRYKETSSHNAHKGRISGMTPLYTQGDTVLLSLTLCTNASPHFRKHSLSERGWCSSAISFWRFTFSKNKCRESSWTRKTQSYHFTFTMISWGRRGGRRGVFENWSRISLESGCYNEHNMHIHTNPIAKLVYVLILMLLNSIVVSNKSDKEY